MDTNDLLKYFRHNISESYNFYTIWKLLHYSVAPGFVGDEMAERYLEIQKQYPAFFKLTARSCLVSYVTLILHSFDKRKDSSSLYKIDRSSTEKFLEENQKIVEKLKIVRDRLFAHKSKSVLEESLEIPSIADLDNFYKNLSNYYNSLSSELEDSTTIFDNSQVKSEIENLYMNLDRGETMRKKEIDIEWKWRKSACKASDNI